jgi:hypothetical protein
VSQVYAHWDNYLEGTGKTLLACYNTLQLAEALVSGGNISSVGKDVDSTEYYGRDRGEEGTDAREFASLHDYDCGYESQEYNYLFRLGRWEVTPYGEEMMLLERALQTA